MNILKRWMVVGWMIAGVACAGVLAAPARKQKAPAKPKKNVLVIPRVEKKDQICFALYTVQNGVLKLSAHLYPLKQDESQKVALQVMRNDEWTTIAEAPVHTELQKHIRNKTTTNVKRG